MQEITVKTTGNFGLIDFSSDKQIPMGETVTVPLTPFIIERLDLGQLEDMGDAPAEAAPDLEPDRTPMAEHPELSTDEPVPPAGEPAKPRVKAKNAA